MAKMVEKEQPAEGLRPRPWRFVARLVFVLAIVVAAVLLFKRATSPERQLQAVLDAENRAMNQGDWEAFADLLDPQDPAFRRYQKTQFDSFLFARQRGEAWAGSVVPSHVVEVHRREDGAWALVMADPDGDPASGPAKIEFFRREYGQWLHTGPDPDHWGQPQESQTEHVTWHYREADAGQVADLAAVAEAFTQQVCADLGLDLEAGALEINLCYSLDCGYVVYPLDRALNLPTPLLFGQGREDLEYLLAHLLGHYLVSRAAGLDEGSPAVASRILNGIERWEVAELTAGAPGGDPLYTLRQAVGSDTLLTLDEISEPLEGDRAALVYAEAYTLVEYLVAQHGRQILPALVRAGGRRVGFPETLQAVLGPDLDLAAFEAGWLSFIRERYGD